MAGLLTSSSTMSRHRLKRSFHSGKRLDEDSQGAATIADQSASSAKLTGNPNSNSNPNQNALTYDQAYAKYATLPQVWGSNTTVSEIADACHRVVALRTYLERLRRVGIYRHPQIHEYEGLIAWATLLMDIDLGTPPKSRSAIPVFGD
jgi:hypothetical protein